LISTPLDRYTLLFSVILGIESLGYAIVLPLVPFLAQQQGAGTLAIGAVFALYSICQLISAPLIGIWSDRGGRKPLLLLSQATTAAGFLILAGANSFGLILLSRVVDGASAGNVSLIYTAVLDRYTREARAAALGILSAGTGLGLLAGPLLGGWLGAAGLAVPALVAAVLAGGTLALTAIFFPGRPPAGRTAPGDLRAGFAVLRDPAIRRTLRLILLNNTIYNAFVLTMPVFLQQRLGYDATQVGPLLTGLLMLGAGFQIFALPRLLTRLANRRSAWLGFSPYAAGFALLIPAATLPAIVVAATLALWGLVILNPVLAAALGNQTGGTDDGAVMGLNQAMASTGQIAGPLLGYAALGGGGGFGLGLACLALTVIGLWLLRKVEIYG
jgi:predicted MFS family arabinose efflux permease